MYIYIYIYVPHRRETFHKMQENAMREDFYWPRMMDEYEQHVRPRRGTNGVSTNGVTANLIYLLPRSVKIPYLRSGPIRVDPICPQANAPRSLGRRACASRPTGHARPARSPTCSGR